jgi:hypothetical protein
MPEPYEEEPSFLAKVGSFLWNAVKFVAVAALVATGAVLLSDTLRGWVDEHTGGQGKGLGSKIKDTFDTAKDTVLGWFGVKKEGPAMSETPAGFGPETAAAAGAVAVGRAATLENQPSPNARAVIPPPGGNSEPTTSAKPLIVRPVQEALQGRMVEALAGNETEGPTNRQVRRLTNLLGGGRRGTETLARLNAEVPLTEGTASAAIDHLEAQRAATRQDAAKEVLGGPVRRWVSLNPFKQLRNLRELVATHITPKNLGIGNVSVAADHAWNTIELPKITADLSTSLQGSANNVATARQHVTDFVEWATGRQPGSGATPTPEHVAAARAMEANPFVKTSITGEYARQLNAAGNKPLPVETVSNIAVKAVLPAPTAPATTAPVATTAPAPTTGPATPGEPVVASTAKPPTAPATTPSSAPQTSAPTTPAAPAEPAAASTAKPPAAPAAEPASTPTAKTTSGAPPPAAAPNTESAPRPTAREPGRNAFLMRPGYSGTLGGVVVLTAVPTLLDPERSTTEKVTTGAIATSIGTSLVAQSLGAAEVAGRASVVGNAILTPVSAYNAYKAFDEGDTYNGVINSAYTVGGGLMLAGATGVVTAPVLVPAGAVIVGGAFVVDTVKKDVEVVQGQLQINSIYNEIEDKFKPDYQRMPTLRTMAADTYYLKGSKHLADAVRVPAITNSEGFELGGEIDLSNPENFPKLRAAILEKKEEAHDRKGFIASWVPNLLLPKEQIRKHDDAWLDVKNYEVALKELNNLEAQYKADQQRRNTEQASPAASLAQAPLPGQLASPTTPAQPHESKTLLH